MNMCWLNFPFQSNTNVETTLGHQYWINVTLSTLFQRCFVNVDKSTSAQLSFSTKYQRWRSTLFQRWFKVDVFAERLEWKTKTVCRFFVIPKLYIIISSTQFGTNEVVISRIEWLTEQNRPNSRRKSQSITGTLKEPDSNEPVTLEDLLKVHNIAIYWFQSDMCGPVGTCPF